eukprot:CAMPEP_0119107922 /NCGR_PEP_ID=MMETSP1180-20130426/12376_2 /TAXON_ID=3052 ORGANISM="Chlamydomonas cf sp, Strain CCMP681" /NCGR_SAMPLE_ID=MMETSP1180 /ASSEMBLY_ACC=CAM_ASM_000741 /LENGTH=180 /DNA_ID=CAMNT_0007093471 /DNA_START=200 /DNA_END=737 /DNA_ORIENTATION=-
MHSQCVVSSRLACHGLNASVYVPASGCHPATAAILHTGAGQTGLTSAYSIHSKGCMHADVDHAVHALLKPIPLTSDNYSSGLPPGTSIAMLFPLSKIWGSLVSLGPSAVNSTSSTSSSTMLTYMSKPRRVPISSLSPFIRTQILLPIHLSMSSDGSMTLVLPAGMPFLGAIMMAVLMNPP